MKKLFFLLLLLLAACTTVAVSSSETPQPCPEWATEAKFASCKIELGHTSISPDGSDYFSSQNRFDLVRVTVTNGELLFTAAEGISVATDRGVDFNPQRERMTSGTYIITAVSEDIDPHFVLDNPTGLSNT